MQTVNINQWLATPGEYFWQNWCGARGRAFLRAERGAVEGLGRKRRPTDKDLLSRQHQILANIWMVQAIQILRITRRRKVREKKVK